VSRFAAPISISPRPQPTSSTISSPRHGIASSTRSRRRTFPTRLPQTIKAASASRIDPATNAHGVRAANAASASSPAPQSAMPATAGGASMP
jgi:hypothetical protein